MGSDKSFSNIAKQISTHRDSITLAHQRLAHAVRENPRLQSARDSIILTKGRFDKYPTSQVTTDLATGKVTIGGLSPILDASPPDNRGYCSSKPIKREEMHVRFGGTPQHGRNHDDKDEGDEDEWEDDEDDKDETHVDRKGFGKQSAEIDGHPEFDDDCAICAIERPRSNSRVTTTCDKLVTRRSSLSPKSFTQLRPTQRVRSFSAV